MMMSISDFVVVQFSKQQTFRILRSELISPMAGSQVTMIGDSVMARENSSSSPELATLYFVGDQSSCFQEQLRLIKDKNKKDSDPTTTTTTTVVTEQQVDYKQKYQYLELIYDQLQSQVSDLMEKLQEKDTELDTLREKVTKLESRPLPTVVNQHLLQNGSICSNQTSSSKPAKCICNCKVRDEIRELILQLNTNVANTQPIDPSDENGYQFKVSLIPNSTTLVSRTRLAIARKVAAPTMYAHRIFTAVFTYDECIGATVYGTRVSAAAKRNLARHSHNGGGGGSGEGNGGVNKVDYDDDSDDNSISILPKALPREKLVDLEESAKLFYKGHEALCNLKSVISWKLNSINKGEANRADLVDWEGYDPVHHQLIKCEYEREKELRKCGYPQKRMIHD